MEHSPRVRHTLRLLAGAAVVAAAGALVADALMTGPLEPRDPSTADVGVLAGTVAELPPGAGPQQPVVLHFTGAGVQRAVPTRHGGAFSLELPPGTYAITDASGQGVCPVQIVVHAGAWQRNDLLWPCTSDRPLG